nr:Immunoglobulin-like domain BIg-containing protein [Salmonella enterica]
MSQVDWASEGFEGTKLAYLAAGAGFFYDRHRAANDCGAAIELLASTLPRSGRTGLSHLLQAARRATWRIWAADAPFAVKDRLKQRGYRWNGDGGATPRAWYANPVRVGNTELTTAQTEYHGVTDGQGNATVVVTQENGPGVKTRLIVSSQNYPTLTDNVDVIFTTITSPDSDKASMHVR